MRALVVHGHFYQPPRENPWTQAIEREPGAEPFHDWNERIFHECYRANAYGRIYDDQGRIERLVNNYAHISFNFGPTLMSWLERHHTVTYGRIIEADRESARARGGHGNAIAQGYNHAILPLCNARDRVTQVRWGLEDFRHRFGRRSEGLWLPETACDHETLEVLIDAGVRFTILSPYQAARVRPLAGGEWRDASGGRLDPTIPYRYLHSDGSGRFIELFFYDGPRSRAIAFEGTLSSSQSFIENLTRGGAGPMVSVATDGESYGHHAKFGDRVLAHALEYEAPRLGLWVTNYSEVLERVKPTHQVELWLGADGRGSSWSCAHGVGRWRQDCGCHTGGREGWNQGWRKPLRQALDLLRDAAAAVFEDQGGGFLEDPWAARDDYIQVLLEGNGALDSFFARHGCRTLSAEDRVTARSLLEMQHQAMLMYTSCGWFFSDLSGIETRQILRYAGRALDLLQDLGHQAPFQQFLEQLAEAKSNHRELGNGADIFRRFVEPARVTPRRVAAHAAMTALVDESDEAGEIAGYAYDSNTLVRKRVGRLTLFIAQVKQTSTETGRTCDLAVLALHLGGVDFYAVVREGMPLAELEQVAGRLERLLTTASIPALLKAAAAELGPDEYGLEHLLPGGRERVSELVLGNLMRRFAEQYSILYEENRRTLDMLSTAGFALPKELAAAAELTLGRVFEEEIREQKESQDPAAYRKAIDLAEEIAEHGYHIDRTASSQTFTHMINHAVSVALARTSEESLDAAVQLFELAERLHLPVNLDRAQELVYEAIQSRSSLACAELDRLAALVRLSPKLMNAKPGSPAQQPV